MEKAYRRLTTEDPQGNYQWLHNMTVIKNREVYLRDYNGEGDLNLIDYCRKECKERCDRDIDVGAEEFGEYMDCDCIVALFYHMAVGHAELRAHLKKYEDTGLSPWKIQQEIERLKNWVNDLQSGMYVNCVYCGHRYGLENETPSSMADVLKQHIEQCHEHPMSKLKEQNHEYEQLLKKVLKCYYRWDMDIEMALEISQVLEKTKAVE